MKYILLLLFSFSIFSNEIGWDVSNNRKIIVHISDAFTNDEFTQIKQAILLWDHKSFIVSDKRIKNKVFNIMDKYIEDNIFGIYKIKNSNNILNKSIAVAITSTINNIQSADILINYYNYKFVDKIIFPYKKGIDLQSLVVHEFGHFMGLLHVDEPNSVMYPTMDEDTINRYPSKLDRERLNKLYRRTK